MGESKWKSMAEANTCLRVLVGSQAYGLSVDQASDRDERGVVLEPLEALLGFHEFEQYEFRTAAERTGIKDAKSEPGDLDLTLYSLKKFLRLAMQGNPSVIELLYVKPIKMNAIGGQLRDLAPHIVSRQCGKRFLGYMEAQRQRLLGERGQKKVNRSELEAKFGYDTKYAGHVVRLGVQGVELLSTGTMTLPLNPKDREFILGIRRGEVELNEALNRAGELERELKDLLDHSPLDEHPNEALVEDWMIHTYWNWWRAQRFKLDHAGLTSLLGETK